MKNLIYKNNAYYMSDISNTTNGKTQLLPKYIASATDMPHKHFLKYIVIYGRKTCPYCIKTINLLTNYKTKQSQSQKQSQKQPKQTKQVKVLFVEIDTEPSNLFNKTNLLQLLSSEISDHTTVPIVFDKGKFIGGSSDAEKYFV